MLTTLRASLLDSAVGADSSLPILLQGTHLHLGPGKCLYNCMLQGDKRECSENYSMTSSTSLLLIIFLQILMMMWNVIYIAVRVLYHCSWHLCVCVCILFGDLFWLELIVSLDCQEQKARQVWSHLVWGGSCAHFRPYLITVLTERMNEGESSPCDTYARGSLISLLCSAPTTRL